MNGKRIKSRNIKARRYLSPVVAILVGTVISIAGYTLASSLDRQVIRAEFVQKTQNHFETIKREIESNLQAVVSVKAFCDSIGYAGRSEFRDFARPHLSTNPSVQAIEWIPCVPRFERVAYEAAARQSGLSGFQIIELDLQGNTIRAAEREEYFPVYFAEPYQGNEVALGFDLASNPVRKKALEKSRDTGEPSATGRITLVQETAAQFGFLVFAPVYRKGAATDSLKARRENLKGFALGVFRIGDIVEKSLTHLKPEGIDIYLYDKSAESPEESFLYSHASRTGKPALFSISNGQTGPDGRLENVRTLNVANREWLVLMKPGPDFAGAGKTRQPWGVLAAGLLLTAMLAKYLIVHKRAAEGLRESEENFRTLVNYAPDAIFIQTEGRFAYVNEAALRLFGATSQEELLDRPVLDRFHPDFLAAGRERIRLLNEAKTPVPALEQKYLRLDGTSVDVEVSAVPFSYANHDGALVFARDITERRRMEKDLRHSEEHFRLSFDQSPIGAALVNLDYRMNRVNKAYCRMLGYSEEELLSLRFCDITHPDDLKTNIALQEKLAAGELDYFMMEKRYIRKDKSIIPASIFVRMVRDAEGSPMHFMAIAEDITDRKRMEEALRESCDEMELRVRERTAELEKANEELRQIPSKLIAVQEEERKRLAAELHDSIGQTLAAVKFWIEMLLKLGAESDGSAVLSHLGQFVPILQRSIDETRSIYMGLRPSMLDSMGLLATLEWLRRECMKLYPQHHIELESRIAEEEIPESLKINVFRIVQEALNNVAKHSKAEWTDVSLSRGEKGLELVISDDGAGMDLESILHTNTARSLGLTSMRERAELSGGCLSIESAPGEGTTIRVCWPAAADGPDSRTPA
jgi:PAS domain S-box-containing protein